MLRGRCRVLNAASLYRCAAAAGRVPVIAGAGSNNTAESMRLMQHAKSVGADAALVVTPYYNKPTQAGLFAHYEAIVAEAEVMPAAARVARRAARTARRSSGGGAASAPFLACALRTCVLCGETVWKFTAEAAAASAHATSLPSSHATSHATVLFGCGVATGSGQVIFG